MVEINRNFRNKKEFYFFLYNISKKSRSKTLNVALYLKNVRILLWFSSKLVKPLLLFTNWTIRQLRKIKLLPCEMYLRKSLDFERKHRVNKNSVYQFCCVCTSIHKMVTWNTCYVTWLAFLQCLILSANLLSSEDQKFWEVRQLAPEII